MTKDVLQSNRHCIRKASSWGLLPNFVLEDFVWVARSDVTMRRNALSALERLSEVSKYWETRSTQWKAYKMDTSKASMLLDYSSPMTLPWTKIRYLTVPMLHQGYDHLISTLQTAATVDYRTSSTRLTLTGNIPLSYSYIKLADRSSVHKSRSLNPQLIIYLTPRSWQSRIFL